MLQIPPKQLDTYAVSMTGENFDKLLYSLAIVPGFIALMGIFVGWLRKELGNEKINSAVGMRHRSPYLYIYDEEEQTRGIETDVVEILSALHFISISEPVKDRHVKIVKADEKWVLENLFVGGKACPLQFQDRSLT